MRNAESLADVGAETVFGGGVLLKVNYHLTQWSKGGVCLTACVFFSEALKRRFNPGPWLTIPIHKPSCQLGWTRLAGQLRAGFGYTYGGYNHPLDLWSAFLLFTFHTTDHRTRCPSCTSREEPNSSSCLLHQIVVKSRRGIEPRTLTPQFNSKPDMPIGLSLIGRAVLGWFWLYLTKATNVLKFWNRDWTRVPNSPV